MRSFRSPNPLIDGRRPFNGSVADINPPGFVWHPIEGASRYELRVGSDPELESADTRSYSVEGRALWVSPDALERGTYYWAWRALGAGQDDVWSETFSFHVTEGTAELRIPSGETVVSRIGNGHPRHLLTESRLEAFREDCKRGSRAGEWRRLRNQARDRLAEDYIITEPPFLPDRKRESELWGKIRKEVTGGSNQMGQDAQLFALVYLVDGEQAFGEAAVKRLLEFTSWDVDGSTSTFHHNAPHMATINLCPRAYDWAYDLLSEGERQMVVAALGARGNQTMERFGRANYGVTGYDNHSGRLLGFLGECGIALAGEHEDVASWFDFILPTTVAMYPWWGGREGGWAQGVSYSSAYCYLYYHFLLGIREAANIDFYKKAFFRSHGDWRLFCVPPNAYLVPFGDGRTGASGSIASNWGIQRHLGRVYGDARFLKHAEQSYDAAGGDLVESRGLFSPLSFLTPESPVAKGDLPTSGARLFSDIGWLAIRTNLVDLEEDVRFMMRSSQYGSESHSHADQNAFVIEAYGEPLAVPSGLYNLYDSAHHHGWTRQTKAHNAITIDGAGQIARSPDAVGRFTGFYQDDHVVYARADASAAYGMRAEMAERTVLFVEGKVILLIDRMRPNKLSDLAPISAQSSPAGAMWTWHLHAVKPIDVRPDEKRAIITYDRAGLDVVFCHADELLFKSHEGWDVLPFGCETLDGVPEEAAKYHLDVGSIIPVGSDLLLTAMCPFKAGGERAHIETIGAHGARITTGDREYLVVVGEQGDGIDEAGCVSDGEIVLRITEASGTGPGRSYVVGGSQLQTEGEDLEILEIQAEEILQ